MNGNYLIQWYRQLWAPLEPHPILYWTSQIILLSLAAWILFLFLYRFLFRPFLNRFMGFHVNQEQSKIRRLLKTGNYDQAGEALLMAGRTEDAIRAFKTSKNYLRIAEIAAKNGELERAARYYKKAGNLPKAAEMFLQAKDYEKANFLMEKLGKENELGDLYKAKGERALAARAYIRGEQYGNAGDLLIQIGKTFEAAIAFYKGFEISKKQLSSVGEEMHPETKRLGLQAARLFEKTRQFKRATDLYLKFNLPADAARCLIEIENFRAAAELFEKAGNLEEAARLWTRLGDQKMAARLEAQCFLRDGQKTRAILKFQEAGDFLRAGELYAQVQEPLKAAEMYEQGGENSLAASYYRQGGELEKAGNAFEKAQEWKEALSCFIKTQNSEKEMILRTKINHPLAIAQFFFDKGDFSQALKEVEKIREGDLHFRSSVALKGKTLMALGEAAKAQQCFDYALSMAQRLSGEDLDTLYNLAKVANQNQSQTNALNLLERMLGDNLVEEPAIEKAKKVQQILTERAFDKVDPFNEPTLGEKPFSPVPGQLSKTNRYEILKEIGRGGMGIVYTAKDRTLERIVALKVLPESFKKNERAIQTFFREAKAAASLNHPNIVTIHDTGIQDGNYYIAMEYIEGNTVKEILRKRKKLTYASVFEVLKQLLSGLAYAHSKNVVHRDLTTNNIMWTQQKILKIMDFGLAKVVKELLNEQSIIGGTPSFMSPEQTLGKPIDHRADIYSLGIIIYEMCIGKLPFTEGDLGYHHLHTPPPIPRDSAQDIPDVLNDMILRCMQKDPKDRFQNAGIMLELLSQVS